MALQSSAGAALLTIFLLFGSASAFYLPGVAPQDFAQASLFASIVEKQTVFCLSLTDFSNFFREIK